MERFVLFLKIVKIEADGFDFFARVLPLMTKTGAVTSAGTTKRPVPTFLSLSALQLALEPLILAAWLSRRRLGLLRETDQAIGLPNIAAFLPNLSRPIQFSQFTEDWPSPSKI